MANCGASFLTTSYSQFIYRPTVKILAVVIRAHDVSAECRLNWLYDIGINCEF